MSDTSLGIGQRIARGAGWMVLMRLALRSIGLVSTVILARLLLPADFGIVAIATTFVALLEVMSEFNFSVYLIREQHADRSDYDTAWTLAVVRGVILAGLLVLSAPYAAAFFERPALEAIVYALAAVTIAEGCANVGIVDFRKSLNFDREFRFTVYVKLVSFVVTVPLAWVMRNYWALAIGILSGKLAHLVLSYVMHPYRPRLSLARCASILAFSKWLLLNQLLAFISNRSDVFIIGKVVGPGSLGLYSVAQEMATLATSELVMPVQRALLPGYARLSGDPDALKRGYIQGLSLLVMAGVPIAAGIALMARPLVAVALGETWLDAVPLIEVLAIAGVLRIFRANSGPLLLAMGLPQLTSVVAAAVTLTAIPLLIWWTPAFGAYGAAWAVTVATAAGALLNFAVVVRALDIHPGDIGRAVWRSIGSAAVMVYVVSVTSDTLRAGDMTMLVAGAAAGAASYLGAHLVLWGFAGRPEGPERQVLTALGSRFVASSGV